MADTEQNSFEEISFLREQLELERADRQKDREQITSLIQLLTNRQQQPDPTSVMASLTTRIPRFEFDIESNNTFPKWYQRYGAIISTEGAALNEQNKVRLLLGRLADDLYEQYTSNIAPNDPYACTFDDTVKTLSAMFDVKKSQFALRYECLQISRQDCEQMTTYFRRINDLCERAKLKNVDNETWKVLLAICGLNAPNDAQIRTILLSFLERRTEDNLPTKLADLLSEYDKVCTRQSDANRIGKRYHPVVNSTSANRKDSAPNSADKQPRPNIHCWNCGKAGHRRQECRCEESTCTKCYQNGHIEQFCDKLKSLRSKQKRPNQVLTISRCNTLNRPETNVLVNNTQLQFQVDTGSDVTLIGLNDWKRLKSPKLEIIQESFLDASGSELRIYGRFHCQFVLNGSNCNGYLYVRDHGNLLGLEWMLQNKYMRHHIKCITNTGSQKGQKRRSDACLKLDQNCTNNSLAVQSLGVPQGEVWRANRNRTNAFVTGAAPPKLRCSSEKREGSRVRARYGFSPPPQSYGTVMRQSSNDKTATVPHTGSDRVYKQYSGSSWHHQSLGVNLVQSIGSTSRSSSSRSKKKFSKQRRNRETNGQAAEHQSRKRHRRVKQQKSFEVMSSRRSAVDRR